MKPIIVQTASATQSKGSRQQPQQHRCHLGRLLIIHLGGGQRVNTGGRDPVLGRPGPWEPYQGLACAVPPSLPSVCTWSQSTGSPAGEEVPWLPFGPVPIL